MAAGDDSTGTTNNLTDDGLSTVLTPSQMRELFINTNTITSQQNIQAIEINDGYLITYKIYYDGATSGFGQVYDDKGNKIYNEFLISVDSNLDNNSAIVSVGKPSGGFVSIWNDNSGNLISRSFDANYVSFSNATLLSDGDNKSYLAVQQLSNNGYIISWTENVSSNFYYSGKAFSLVFDSNGGQVPVSPDLSESGLYSHGLVNTSFGFASIWTSSSKAYVITYDFNGNIVSPKIIVNSFGGVVDITDIGNEIFSVVNEDGNEYIYDLLGNRLTYGTDSDDQIDGTSIDDMIVTLKGSDYVLAADGNDTVELSIDAVWGSGFSAKNVGNDNAIGTGQSTTLLGFNRFTDVIDGGDGVDLINLTSGNDALFIDDVYSEHYSLLALTSTIQGINSTSRIINLESIHAGAGDDIVDLTSGNFILTQGVSINGGSGDDVLWASNGNDTIDGGDGNYIIFGGYGIDTLTGGNGSDIFQFTASSGVGVVSDFDLTNDSIQLYYRSSDNHINSDLNLNNGILTWDSGAEFGDVSIYLNATTTSSDLSDLDALITFVEIV